MAAVSGKVAYGLYRAATRFASPVIHAHIRWRILRGLDHPTRWPERLGRPSSPRPLGPLLWFHAVSLGEGLAAIPVIKHCIKHRPHLNVLMTTTTTSAFEAIKDQLPSGVIYQFAPVDTPKAVEDFLGYWEPIAILLMERDLKNAIGDLDVPEEGEKIKALKLQLANRPVWMAASLHKGEEEVMLWVHKELRKMYPELVTILVPRHPQHGQHIIQLLKRQGMNVVVRSRTETISPDTSLYVVDTLGELRMLYRVTPIAVVGGSFLPCLAGHNISEAAAAGCAVLTGPHIGHFSHMVAKMQQADPLSVLQVAGKMELVESLDQLLSKTKAREARQNAARRAFLAISDGVVQRVWNQIETHVFSKQT